MNETTLPRDYPVRVRDQSFNQFVAGTDFSRHDEPRFGSGAQILEKSDWANRRAEVS
jgi:hypothetical protein